MNRKQCLAHIILTTAESNFRSKSSVSCSRKNSNQFFTIHRKCLNLSPEIKKRTGCETFLSGRKHASNHQKKLRIFSSLTILRNQPEKFPTWMKKCETKDLTEVACLNPPHALKIWYFFHSKICEHRDTFDCQLFGRSLLSTDKKDL